MKRVIYIKKKEEGGIHLSPPNTAASTVVFALGPGPGPVLSANVMDAAVRIKVRPPTKVRPPKRPSSAASSSDSKADTVPPVGAIGIWWNRVGRGLGFILLQQRQKGDKGTYCCNRAGERGLVKEGRGLVKEGRGLVKE